MSDDRIHTVLQEAPSGGKKTALSGTALALCCAGLAMFLTVRATMDAPDPSAESGPAIEADMLVDRGNGVDLYLNDWQHPPERVPVVAGERHIYRFTRLPSNITLLRFDPTDVPDAHIVLYSLAVKIGHQTLRQFGPAELKTWTLHDLSPPQEQDGGLVMSDTTDDPILWTKVNLHLPVKASGWPARMRKHYRSLLLAAATLLFFVLLHRGNKNLFLLECALTSVAAALALWILATTINLACVGWVPVPVGDDWDRWLTYVGTPHYLEWLFQQHADHRIVASKLLLEIDHFVFHARGWFPLLCTFLLQALTGFLLWRLSAHVSRQDRTERWILAAAITACLFSGQQWHNFIWPFQIVFPLLYCAATVALFSLWKGAQQDWKGGAPWVAASMAAATVATYTMANGVLLWPVLLLAALWLRMPRRWLAAMAAGTLLLGVSYFYHWHRFILPPPVPLTTAQRLPRAAIFLFAHLGSPMAPLAMLFSSDNLRLAAAVIPGVLLALVLLVEFVLLWRRREHFNHARAILLFYCLYLAGSSASMAYGRSDGSLFEAFAPRYLTPAYLLWTCMLLLLWPLLPTAHRWPRAALYAGLCAAMFAGVVIHQQNILNVVIAWHLTIPAGEVALVDNVTDAAAWTPLYHTPRIAMDAVDYLRNHHLSIFQEDWTHWPGLPLNRRFVIDRNPDACQGRIEQAAPVPSPLKPGWRVTGWAWDVKADRPPRYIVLADDTGQIAGVALTGISQPTQFLGYVDGQRRPITTYGVEADERSLCTIGTRTLSPSNPEAAITDSGPPLPDIKPEIHGAWSQDGYSQGPNGPGAPPAKGLVYGSFPDGNIGTLRLGPFQLDGHTEIAIPVVTGSDTHDLSLLIRDAGTKVVLAKLDPPAIQLHWWTWHPDLPLGRKITIEIVARDQGSGAGQWLALGWPHALPVK